MPWQLQVALVGGELDPDTGLPAYREVAITVPRQSGKTTLVLAWQIQRALGWGRPQRISYSAQTGNHARKKLIEDWVPILERRRKALEIKPGTSGISKGMGNESVVFRNNSRISLLSSTEDAGHGPTVNLGVRDEFFADADDRRSQALLPSMVTDDTAQMLTISTAGTDASVPLNRLVEQGRASVDAGRRDGIAYFEWSAPEGADMNDEDLWASWMPALGHTQSVRAIRQAKNSPDMTEGEFRRAFGNLAMRSDERLIPAGSWDAVCGGDVAPQGRLTFGVDVNEERSTAAIVAASEDKEIEVIEATSPDPQRTPRSGIGWLPGRIAELHAKWGRLPWAYDAAGPVASVVDGLDLDLDLRPLTGRDLPMACGQLFDDVAEARIRVKRDRALDEAVAGARRTFVGDAWKWVRKDATVDVAPLVAATVGLWAVRDLYDTLDSVR